MTDNTVSNKAYCAICAFTEYLTEYGDIHICRRCDDKYAADSNEEGADADE